ncbi:hypothetical protein AAHC03_016572 [Spirometra sp. Aus1]
MNFEGVDNATTVSFSNISVTLFENLSFPPTDVFNLGMKIGITLPYIPLMIISLIGNALVCFVIQHHLQHSVTNIFLFNLSITDILTTLAVIPITTVADVWLTYWPFGAAMCKLIPFIQCLTVTLTAFTHVLISCDRFAIVFRPLQRRRFLTLRRAKIIVGFIWLFAAIQASPLAVVGYLQNGTYPRCAESWDAQRSQVYGLTLLGLQYFLPLTLLICSYTTISLRLNSSSLRGTAGGNRIHSVARSKGKMVKMMIAVSALYAISQLPRHILFLYGTIVNWGTKELAIAWNIAVFLSSSASCYNPFVYAWMNQTYRTGFLLVFRSVCCCCYKKYPHPVPLQFKSRHQVFTAADEA